MGPEMNKSDKASLKRAFIFSAGFHVFLMAIFWLIFVINARLVKKENKNLIKVNLISISAIKPDINGGGMLAYNHKNDRKMAKSRRPRKVFKKSRRHKKRKNKQIKKVRKKRRVVRRALYKKKIKGGKSRKNRRVSKLKYAKRIRKKRKSLKRRKKLVAMVQKPKSKRVVSKSIDIREYEDRLFNSSLMSIAVKGDIKLKAKREKIKDISLANFIKKKPELSPEIRIKEKKVTEHVSKLKIGSLNSISLKGESRVLTSDIKTRKVVKVDTQLITSRKKLDLSDNNRATLKKSSPADLNVEEINSENMLKLALPRKLISNNVTTSKVEIVKDVVANSVASKQEFIMDIPEIVEEEREKRIKSEKKLFEIKDYTKGLDRAPRVSYYSKLNYPVWAEKKGLEGYVKFKILLEKGASIKDIMTLETTVGRKLASYAKAIINKWKFEPTYKNNKPCEAWVVLKINFTLFHNNS